jgi:hypothetical protein
MDHGPARMRGQRGCAAAPSRRRRWRFGARPPATRIQTRAAVHTLPGRPGPTRNPQRLPLGRSPPGRRPVRSRAGRVPTTLRRPRRPGTSRPGPAASSPAAPPAGRAVHNDCRRRRRRTAAAPPRPLRRRRPSCGLRGDLRGECPSLDPLLAENSGGIHWTVPCKPFAAAAAAAAAAVPVPPRRRLRRPAASAGRIPAVGTARSSRQCGMGCSARSPAASNRGTGRRSSAAERCLRPAPPTALNRGSSLSSLPREPTFCSLNRAMNGERSTRAPRLDVVSIGSNARAKKLSVAAMQHAPFRSRPKNGTYLPDNKGPTSYFVPLLVFNKARQFYKLSCAKSLFS